MLLNDNKMFNYLIKSFKLEYSKSMSFCFIESPKNVPNGIMCYTCNREDCSSTLACVDGEDHCIKATGILTHKQNKTTTKPLYEKKLIEFLGIFMF